MNRSCLRNSLSIKSLIDTIKYFIWDRKNHSTYMRTFGSCVFCGSQGEGKTLSAVQYVCKLRELYPRAILVTNVAIKDYPFNTELVFNNGEPYMRRLDNGLCVNTDTILLDSLFSDYEPITIEYNGLDMLKYVCNAEYGVIFLIDEIHLELNSLESKNIDIEVMTEISQQRKQRKHIVGTSQIFMRMAKPLREQIHDIIICRKYLNVLQFNKWIIGETAVEKNGKLEAEVKGRFLWFHSPKMYQMYDTFAKMKRYNEEWQGRKRIDIYEKGVVQDVEFRK